MELNWLIVFHLQFGKTLQYHYNSDRINEGTESLRRVIIKPYIDWFELWVIKGTHMSTLYKHVRDVQAFAEVVSLFVWNDVKQFIRDVDNSRKPVKLPGCERDFSDCEALLLSPKCFLMLSEDCYLFISFVYASKSRYSVPKAR